MKRTYIRAVSTAAAAKQKVSMNLAQSYFDVIVVGGGLTGCLVAGRLAMENMKTLLIQSGCDIRTKQQWHRTVPASCLMHRIAHRGYELESSRCTTVPQQSYRTQHNEQQQQRLQQKQQKQIDVTQKTTVTIPTPHVLGGHNIMGSKCWYYGDCNDWQSSVWNFRGVLLPKLRSLQSPQIFSTHRGKRGKFTLSNPSTFSPYYKPFCEAISSNTSMTGQFVHKNFTINCSCGRPEMWVDPTTHKAHTSLQRFVMLSVQLQRPLTVQCNATVQAILADNTNQTNGIDSKATIDKTNQVDNKQQQRTGDSQKASGVRLRQGNGEVMQIHSSEIVLCAGSLGSAQILHTSCRNLTSLQHVGNEFWDIPQVVLQYRTKDRQSYNSLTDSLVQMYLKTSLRLGKTPRALFSSWDDMIWYYSSHNEQSSPDVQIIFQPFTINNDGTSPLPQQHGCQFVIRPIRPKSRGCITVDGRIDPRYFTSSDDQAAVQKAVMFVQNEIVKHPSFASILDGLISEKFESSGINGGSCSAAVDLQTCQLRGTSNVYVCDGSILPFPVSGALLPYKLAIADMFVDKHTQIKKVKGKVKETARFYSEETRIIY